jgi:hypothetical protein
MRRLFAVAPIFVLAALLVSCGSKGNTEPKSTPVWPGERWQLEYSNSGGVAGIDEHLSLDSKGSITTEDKRTGRTRQGYVVHPDTVMVGLLASALPSTKSDQGLPHPDAIITSVKVTAGNKTYGATFNTVPSDPGVASLLRRLTVLYQDNRP